MRFDSLKALDSLLLETSNISDIQPSSWSSGTSKLAWTEKLLGGCPDMSLMGDTPARPPGLLYQISAFWEVQAQAIPS